MHAWNRAFADTSITLLTIVILIGLISKLNQNFIRFLPWRRELGIWSAITVFFHIYIVFDGWFQWRLVRAMTAMDSITGRLFFDAGFALANLIGLVAFYYILLLAITSNKKSVSFLGKTAWDYIQSKSNILYPIVLLHIFFFVFLYRPENPNWLKVPFVIVITTVFILQWLTFFLTLSKRK